MAKLPLDKHQDVVSIDADRVSPNIAFMTTFQGDLTLRRTINSVMIANIADKYMRSCRLILDSFQFMEVDE